MTWLAWIACSLPLLVLLLACVPLHIDFHVSSTPNWSGHARLRWGRVLRLHWAPADSGTSQTAGKQTRRHNKRTKRRKWSTFGSLPPGSFAHVAAFVRRFIGQTHVGSLQLHLCVGCDDPADTGVLFGALVPLLVPLTQNHPDVWVEPSFLEECFDFDGRGQVTIVPIYYLVVFVVFVVSPKTWRITAALVRA